jgi:hypothetical protein
MLFMLFLILVALCLGHLGLGARANLVIAIVLLVIGAILVFSGWDGSFSLRADVD